MKVISLWQPYAALLIHGYKVCETRTWPCPAYLLSKRIGIASTKTVRSEQRKLMENATFSRHYNKTGLPELDDLPHGVLLGTARVAYCEQIAANHIQTIGEREFVFGDWTIGNWAWRMVDHEVWKTPVPISGKQGLWDYDGETIQELQDRAFQKGQADLRRDLHDRDRKQGLHRL